MWHEPGRLQALREQLQQLADDGLDPRDYPLPTQGDPACRELLTSHSFLRARANSIEGGTTEIMKNILGEQMLGLPGEPRVDKDVAWSKVPRN